MRGPLEHYQEKRVLDMKGIPFETSISRSDHGAMPMPFLKLTSTLLLCLEIPPSIYCCFFHFLFLLSSLSLSLFVSFLTVMHVITHNTSFYCELCSVIKRDGKTLMCTYHPFPNFLSLPWIHHHLIVLT
jgi:hypothetical protein